MTTARLRALLASLIAASALTLATPATPVAASTQPCSSWLRLPDISNWNGNPDWPKVAKAGIAAVYIQQGDGNWQNPTWFPNVAGATSVGLPWGGYQFARPGTTDATATADRFVDAGGARGTLPPVIDLEASTLDANSTVLWALTWIQRVQARSGRTPTIYTGGFYPWSSDPRLAPYPLWLAAYPNGYNPVGDVCALPRPSTPGAWGEWSLWQFTSVGNVWGIQGNTDLNVADPRWFETYTGASIAPPGSAGNRYPAPVYGPGSIGPKVVQIQQLLSRAGLYAGRWDGYYSTGAASVQLGVMLWQQKLGLTADGFWGPATERATQQLAALVKALHVKRPKPPLRYGERGANVRRLQRALHVLDGYGAINGTYGKATAAHVGQFKKACRLPKWRGKTFNRPAAACLDARLKGMGR